MRFYLFLVSLLWVCYLGCMFNPSAVQAESSGGLVQIKKQYREFLWKLEEEKGELPPVEKWLRALGPDGSWKDVHYDDASRSKWRAMEHLDRLLNITLAYTDTNSKLHGDATLEKAIHAALNCWLTRDLHNPNWWYNEIGAPMTLSHILILLDRDVTPEEMQAALKILARADDAKNMTGQNLVWVSGITLTRGLLENRFDLVQKKRDLILSEVTVTMAEGIQPDFSFHQHGPQQQFGNYGLSFANDIVQWMLILRGTSLAFDNDPGKVEVMRDYLLKGEDYVVWKGAMDISSCGRQLTPHSPDGKGKSVLKIMAEMLLVDPQHVSSYQASLDRNAPTSAGADDTLIGNRYFWRSDYMVHRRPKFFVSTKMCSSRVIGTELVNEENISGLHMAHGATFIYRNNDEYRDIFPVWDWFRVPGVTCFQGHDKKLLRPENVFSSAYRDWMKKQPDFVGGVSDGMYGAAALDYDAHGLSGRKSWFYFDDQVVCLGAGFKSDLNEDVATSVNQCLAHGDVTVADEKGESVASAKGWKEYDDLRWAYHDGMGYLFLKPERVTLGIQPQSGSWREDVLLAGDPATVTKDVFSIWIDHGMQPQDGHSAYSLFPGISLNEWKAKATQPNVTLLANTPNLQAVREEALGITMAAFFQPGTLTYADGKNLTVAQPCLILFHEQDKKITVADPTQKLRKISVTIDDVTRQIPLPSSPQAGMSVEQTWK